MKTQDNMPTPPPDLSQAAIRRATADDLAAINAIYNYYIPRSTASYQTEPATPEERAAWFAAHGPRHPVLVAEAAGEVIGWASLSRFHVRAAYQHTVEDSIYLRHDRLARGLGRRLLDELIRCAKSVGHHSVIALISADQEPSLRLHQRAGFAEVARLREVGRKFDRWLDVVYMQRML